MYKPNTDRLWNDAKKCNCQKKDCTPKNHKLCSICDRTMLYGSHFTNEKTRSSEYAWNIDLIIPKCEGGSSKIHNLQVCHINCNKSKKHKDQSKEYVVD